MYNPNTHVKLTRTAERHYPQFKGKVGRITKKREILTKGHGIMSGHHAVSYWVRFSGESRDYFLSGRWLKRC